MYTTIVHPLRKAYCLSINEYCVLEAIRNLQNNTKYDGWCVISQEGMSKGLDLSLSTIRRAYQKLAQVKLIMFRKNTKIDTAVRSVDEWNEWFMADKKDVLLAMKSSTSELFTMQQNEDGVNSVKMNEPSSKRTINSFKMNEQQCQNERDNSFKMSDNTNKDTNKYLKDTKKDFFKKNKNKYAVEVNGKFYINPYHVQNKKKADTISLPF